MMPSSLSSDAGFQAKLDRLKADVRRESFGTPLPSSTVGPPPVAHTRPGSRVVLGRAVKWAVAVALPFVTLVGGSVWLYSRIGMPTWLALIMAVMATGAVLGWYIWRLTYSLSGRVRFRFVLTRVALPMVVVYCTYTLLYLSHVNAKSEDVRQYYTAVHPLLRVALSTATVFDRDLVVTDMARVPSDYDRMGLPRYENSLHFEQADGYVHAVDLRTLRRAAWRNLLIKAYFRLMGFRTLRHVGTADHLHVSLPVPD